MCLFIRYNLQTLVPVLMSEFANVSGAEAGIVTVYLLPTSKASALFLICTLPGCQPQITPWQRVPCSQPEGCQVLREQTKPRCLRPLPSFHPASAPRVPSL